MKEDPYIVVCVCTERAQLGGAQEGSLFSFRELYTQRLTNDKQKLMMVENNRDDL